MAKILMCDGALTSRSTIFKSFWDGAIASWVFTSTLGTLKCLAQGHYTAVVGFEPWTSHFGVQSSTTEPPRPGPDLGPNCLKRLDPDQVKHFVRPDLFPHCLKRL